MISLVIKERKSNCLPEELQSCVPILVKARKFLYLLHGKNKKSNLILCERKQFPLVLAHAKVIHKTQGSIIDYMTVDLDTTNKGGKHPCPIFQGLVYTLLPRARRRDLIQIFNFHADKIKHNKEAWKEMERIRKDCPFVYEHPLEKLQGNKIRLNNIRDWQPHISPFLSDKYYTKYSSVLCFTEIKVSG